MKNYDYAKLSPKALFTLFEQERQEWLAAGMSITTILQLQFGDIVEDLLKLYACELFFNEASDYEAIRAFIAEQIKTHGGSILQYGGDYRTWLDERSHTRTDHKYSPGMPITIEKADPYGELISCGDDGVGDAEFQIDLEVALSTLTDLQRKCFIEVRIKRRTQAEVANEIGVSRDSVKQAIEGAVKKLKKIF